MPTPLDHLIDVHAHFVTDRYIAAARAAGHEHPDGMPGCPTPGEPSWRRVATDHARQPYW